VNPAVNQLSQATKTSMEVQLHAMTELAEKALQGVSELVELNMATAKASFEETSAVVQQILSAADAQEAFHLVQAQAQPSAEKAASYGRHLASIATRTQGEIAKSTQERVADTARHVNSLIDDLTQKAPAGSEAFVSMMKAGIANSNAAYEQFAKVSQTAFDNFQEQLHSASNQFATSATKAAKSKKSAA
jgi:phasin family protein